MAELASDLARLRRLRHECDYAGAIVLAAALVRDLHAAGDDPAALRNLCDATFLASSLLRSLGHPADAWLGAERCYDLAAEIEDPVLLGLAAFARATSAISCGSYARGRALSERAIVALDPHAGAPGALEVVGALHLVRACAERDAGSDSWASEAVRIARHTGETTTYSLYFGPANVNLWHLGFAADTGDPAQAIAIAATVDLTATRVNSRLVFFHTDLARACAALRGRDQDAVRHLLIAERIAPQHVHSSPLVKETTRALLDRAQRQAAGPALRGLCERMQVGR